MIELFKSELTVSFPRMEKLLQGPPGLNSGALSSFWSSFWICLGSRKKAACGDGMALFSSCRHDLFMFRRLQKSLDDVVDWSEWWNFRINVRNII